MVALHQPSPRGDEPRLSIGERVAAMRLRVRQLAGTACTSLDQTSPDAALVVACSDLLRIDAAITVVLPSDDRDAQDVPGYAGLEDERARVLSVIEQSMAEGLPGLKAKAQVLISRQVMDDHVTTANLAHSLARDLLNNPRVSLEAMHDPIFAVIEEGERLEAEARTLLDSCQDLREADPARAPAQEADAAVWKHVNDVVLQTTPTTAAGGIALANYALRFEDRQGVPLAKEEGGLDLLRLIAASASR